jgi:SAM-dependent methyltransferase
MIWESRCLICESAALSTVSATVAPFLKERCAIQLCDPAPRRSYCSNCQFSFFNQRLSAQELSELYRDYRGDAYDSQRERLEPGYQAIAADFRDRDNAYHADRTRLLSEAMAEWHVQPRTVLDYGGEPDAWLARRAFPGSVVTGYEVSVSSRAPTPEGYELVLCGHVLEHVSHPRAFLSDLVRFLPAGGLLYLEVPEESADLAATLLPGHPLNWMHEHQSFFTPRALEQLARVCGLVPLRLRRLRYPLLDGLALLAARPKSGSGPSEDPLRVEGQEPACERPPTRPDLLKVHQQALVWREQGVGIVIHPAGAFAMELLAYTAVGSCRVLALSDNDPAVQGSIRMRKVVVAPAGIPDLRPDLVLIASPRFEDAIEIQLDWLEQHRIPRVRSSRLNARNAGSH